MNVSRIRRPSGGFASPGLAGLRGRARISRFSAVCPTDSDSARNPRRARSRRLPNIALREWRTCRRLTHGTIAALALLVAAVLLLTYGNHLGDLATK